MRRFLFLFSFVFISCTATAQPLWKLKKVEDGIRIYTAPAENSNFKSLKVEVNIAANINQLIAFLLDIEKQPEWVYSTKLSHVLEGIAPNELIFYSEANLPWPCSNRDYIAHFVINQPKPGYVTIDSRTDPDKLPHKKGLVRVPKSIAHWDITSISDHELKIVYTLHFDPGGVLPAWLVNLFLTKGPGYTFQHLRQGVLKPQYKNATFSFITSAYK
jgi:hypothetical protein